MKLLAMTVIFDRANEKSKLTIEIDPKLGLKVDSACQIFPKELEFLGKTQDLLKEYKDHV